VKTAVLLLSCLVLALVSGCSLDSRTSEPTAKTPQRATVAYAVDGDTLRVRLPSRRLAYVRLVGIDTPEDVRPGTPVECGSRSAASSMRALAPAGAPITLRGDSIAAPRDCYGRILAHAFIGGSQLELAQLRRGWAEVYRFEGQRFDGLARFERAQAQARRAGRGVWSACGGNFHSAR
jgi:micrococcal nuclease